MLEYVKPDPISLRSNAELSEAWVQDRIAEDPKVLGLGDLVLKDKERMQPRAGRLDLLFQHAEEARRYEVEVQLGATDEAHIIRCIEYWDIERKRYPQYDHTAVLVAENITSRFLNVISLFNSTIPLVAVQMNAYKLKNQVMLTFTTVLDVLPLGLVDEDETVAEVTDRAYWEERATKSTVGLVDSILEIAKTLDPSLELNYTKFYIGLAREGRPTTFLLLRPQKRAVKVEVKHPRSEELEDSLRQAGIEDVDYESREGRYRLRLEKGEVKKHSEPLAAVITKAYEAYVG